MVRSTELEPGITIRPLERADGPAMLRMFHRLSPETVYRRFFTAMPVVPDSLQRQLIDVDHDHHEALVAVRDGEIIAVARYFRNATAPDTADLAITVEDAWQRHGVGRALMNELTRTAARRGIVHFTSSILTENRPALALTKSLSSGRARTHLDGSEIQVVVDLPPRAA